MESIISASIWPADRINSINPLYNPQCPRCGDMFETCLHTFWECPANHNFEDEDIINTQSLSSHAVQAAVDEPCMWLRGILPSHYTSIPVEYLPSDDYDITYVNNNDNIWDFRVYYGDASGGEFTSIPSLRRCGCGLASLDAAGKLIGGCHFPLPGTIQTVPGAEFFALVVLRLIQIWMQ